jgi:hypothetical protein
MMSKDDCQSSELDQILVVWKTIAELQKTIRPTATGHICTTINVLLEHLRYKELGLSQIDRVTLALMFPHRWERDWCAVV